MNEIGVISYDNAIKDLKKSIEGLNFEIAGNYIRVEFDCTLDNSILKEQLNNKDEIKINDVFSIETYNAPDKIYVYMKIIRSDKRKDDSTCTIISEKDVLGTIESKFKEHYLNYNHYKNIIYSRLIELIISDTKRDVYNIESYIDELDNEDKYKILKYLDESNLGKKELSNDDFENFMKIIKKLDDEQYKNFLNEIHKKLKKKILKVNVS